MKTAWLKKSPNGYYLVDNLGNGITADYSDKRAIAIVAKKMGYRIVTGKEIKLKLTIAVSKSDGIEETIKNLLFTHPAIYAVEIKK